MFTTTPIPNEEAAAMIANKPVFVREAYAALVPEIKARAFTLANIESAEILRNVRDLLAEVPRGADWTETRKSIAAELLSEWGAKATTEEERLKAISRAMIRAEFNLRLHVFQGYQAGRWQTMQRQKKVFPYWKYVAFGDSKVRPTHQALDGLILPADDPFWADRYPPWEWGCRCMVQAVSKADYEEAQARDAQRPAEERQILDEERLQRMRDSGQLTRNGQTMDVRSPRQKDIAKGGDGLNAFGWDPGTLKMDKAELQERYKDHPEAWTAFETSAKSQKLDNGKTVWEWMGGEEKKPNLPPVIPPSYEDAATLREALTKAPSVFAARSRIALANNDRGVLDLSVTASRKAATSNAKVFLQSVVHKDYLPKGLVTIKADRTRGFYHPGLRNAHVRDDVGNVVHELTHAIEKDHPELYQKAVRFRDVRTMGERIEKLRVLTGRKAYKLDEIAYKDEWESKGGAVYSGKVYPDHWEMTEILTMGMERLYNDPIGFAANDPDYFDFIIQLVQKR
jgi:SPP1 gp7 family putative phage head morphogenesis protein